MAATISASFCVCTWLIINLLSPWRGTRPYRHVCSYCMLSQPRGGTPQQAHACSGSFHHWTSLCTVTDCPDTHRVFTAPPGAKVSDVQSGGHVDLCQKCKSKSKWCCLLLSFFGWSCRSVLLILGGDVFLLFPCECCCTSPSGRNLFYAMSRTCVCSQICRTSRC